MTRTADRDADARTARPARPVLDPLDPLAHLNADLDELAERRRDANRAVAAQYRIAARMVLRSGASPSGKKATPSFRYPAQMEWRSLRAETALVLHVGEPTAEKILGYAPILVNDLPRTMAAFSDGRIGESQARTIAEQSIGLTPSEREGLEDVLLPLAETAAPAPFLKRARAERDRRRPEGAEERAKKAAVTDAGVWLDHAPDGRAFLSANIDAVHGAAGFDRLSTMAIVAKNTPGETRSMQQLRAAAFTDLIVTGICSGGAGTGIVGRVSVTVPALSLLGKSTDLAELGGHGPIDVTTAAMLLAEAGTFSRVITDPVTGDVLAVDGKQYRPGAAKSGRETASGAVSGAVSVAVSGAAADAAVAGASVSRPDTAAGLETHTSADADADEQTRTEPAIGVPVGPGIALAAFSRVLTDPVAGATLALERTQYRPPEGMKRWVRLRDGVCRFPGCTRPAMRCELDHILEWHRDQGATNAVNLMCLCAMHHMLKTVTAWNPIAIGGGSIVWTSPAGRTYRTDPQHRMEPVPGLDVPAAARNAAAMNGAAANGAAMNRAATNGAATNGGETSDTDARRARVGFAAGPISEIDLAAPLARVTLRGGTRMHLFADPTPDGTDLVELYGADISGDDISDDDIYGADISGDDGGDDGEDYGEGGGAPSVDDGRVRPPGWEPDLGSPPPDPPIDAYFPSGIPGCVLIALLGEREAGRRTFDEEALELELRRYAALDDERAALDGAAR